jgi:hypothetical protein
VFVIFGILTIVAGILFYSEGVAAFKSSLNEFYDGINVSESHMYMFFLLSQCGSKNRSRIFFPPVIMLQLIQETAYKAINVTDSIIQAKDDIDVEVQPSIDLEAAGQPVCRVTNEEVSSQIREAWALLVANIQNLKTLVEQNLGKFSDDLRRLIQLTEEIEDSLTSAASLCEDGCAQGCPFDLEMFSGAAMIWSYFANFPIHLMVDVKTKEYRAILIIRLALTTDKPRRCGIQSLSCPSISPCLRIA